MKVLLVTETPTGAENELESPASALKELGCAVDLVGFDLALEEDDEESLAKKRYQVLLIDGRDRPETGVGCLKSLRSHTALEGIPALYCATVRSISRGDLRPFDDFLLVPVVPTELYARLRQLDWRFASFAAHDRIKVGDLLLDLPGYEAFVRDRKMELTRQEFELLRFLAQHPNKVWTREQLLSRVWGVRYDGGTRTVDIHVRRLRAKMGTPADLMIETVRNVGYKLRQ